MRPGLQRFFGKRGSRVVDANLALIADAYDGVIDVTAHLTAVVAAPRHELATTGAPTCPPATPRRPLPPLAT